MASVKRDPYKLIGTKLDRYVIQEVAGGGGMGVVYRAQHEITKGTVAIKVLRPDTSLSNDTGVSMFFEEAAKTVTLNHPFIVKVTGADYTPDGLAFMVMEWLDGHTLGDEMHKQGTLPAERVADLLDQICEAVGYAHNKNIIHRDLKPGNIMLVPGERGEETIRVLDFGIAKAMTNTVGTNTRMAGSYYYISPEQTVAQGRIDRCADIYSLGVMLYQMLTGKVPFEADTDGQIIDMHRTFDPVPLSQVNPAIPLGVEAVVLKALAKRPGDRYQNATDLARAFRQAAQLASGVIVLECTDEDDASPVATATVYLNGKHAGQTDETGCWQQNGLTPRKYLIEVEAPRYERWHVSETVGAREEVTIPARLKRLQRGELIIYCGVPNAEVELNGAKVGKTDQSGRLYLDAVNVGSHTIRLTHPRYLAAESSVEIAVWQQALCELTMTERPRFQFIKQLWQKVTGGGTRAEKANPGSTAPLGIGSLREEESSIPTTADPFKTSVDPFKTSVLFEDSPDPAPIPFPAASPQFCGKCGWQVPTGLKFCTECGAPLARKGETTGGEKRVEAYAAPTDLLPQPPEESAPAKAPSKPAPNAAPLTELSSEMLPYVTLPLQPTPKKSTKTRWIVGSAVVVAVGLSLVIWLKPEPPSEVIPTSQVIVTPTVEPVPQPQLTPIGMVRIEGGEFLMGDPDAAETDIDGPQHKVTVDPFFIGEHEVTRAQYFECVQAGRCQAPKPWGGIEFPAGTGELPVTGVSWDDAKAYTNWKSTQHPQWSGLRLPYEKEWEFVARDGKQQNYSWGNEFIPELANTGKKTKELSRVKSYPLSPNQQFQVYDLIGNAWEWMENDFTAYPGSKIPERNDGKAYKVVRGGTYGDSPQEGFRRKQIEPGEDYSKTGFRCAKSVSP